MDRVLHLAQVNSRPNTHAPDSVTLAEDEIVDTEEVHYVEAYQLLLQFSNGVQRLVDFGPFLMTSTNPLIRKYLDLANFKQVALADGNLQWNDYDLCFPIADLYAGSL